MTAPELPEEFPVADDVVRRVGRVLRRADFDVDLHPPSWDLEVRSARNGRDRPDLDAHRALALLVAWHTPRSDGAARFAGPALNVSYALLRARLGLAKDDDVRRLLRRMENDHGLVVRHSGGRGEGRGAFLYVGLDVDRLEEVTYPVTMDPKTGELRPWSAGDPVPGGPYFIHYLARRVEVEPIGLRALGDDGLVHLVSLRPCPDGRPPGSWASPWTGGGGRVHSPERRPRPHRR